jgi:hypothetical protein
MHDGGQRQVVEFLRAAFSSGEAKLEVRLRMKQPGEVRDGDGGSRLFLGRSILTAAVLRAE